MSKTLEMLKERKLQLEKTVTDARQELAQVQAMLKTVENVPATSATPTAKTSKTRKYVLKTKSSLNEPVIQKTPDKLLLNNNGPARENTAKKVYDIISKHGKISLKELYPLCTGYTESYISFVLTDLVKSNRIKRVARATYSI